MKEQFDEIDLYNYWKIIIKRKSLIVLIVSFITILAFALSYFSPKIYQSKSIIRIPMLPISDFEANTEQTTQPVLSISEIESMIENLKDENVLNSKSLKKIVDLELTDIKDLTNDFNLIVQVKDEPDLAVKISNEVLNYLKEDDFTKNKIKKKKEVLLNKISGIRKTIKEALKIKYAATSLLQSGNFVGFNPVEIESKINDLENKKMDFEEQLKSLDGFEYVRKPRLSRKPIKPKPLLSTLLGFFTSLFLSFLIILFLEWLENINKDHGRR